MSSQRLYTCNGYVTSTIPSLQSMYNLGLTFYLRCLVYDVLSTMSHHRCLTYDVSSTMHHPNKDEDSSWLPIILKKLLLFLLITYSIICRFTYLHTYLGNRLLFSTLICLKYFYDILVKKCLLLYSEFDSSGSVKKLKKRVFLKRKFGETKLH